MDEADLAFDSEQQHLAQAVAAQRGRAGRMQLVGTCHYCGNTLEGRVFCDPDCPADWEAAQLPRHPAPPG